MGPFARKDVVLFPFPYTDLSDRKLRPCLVLSPEMGQDVLLCQITSQKMRQDEYAVVLKARDTVQGSLQIDSLIRANRLFTASKHQIHRKLDEVSDSVYREVIEKINDLVSP